MKRRDSAGVVILGQFFETKIVYHRDHYSFEVAVDGNPNVRSSTIRTRCGIEAYYLEWIELGTADGSLVIQHREKSRTWLPRWRAELIASPCRRCFRDGL